MGDTAASRLTAQPAAPEPAVPSRLVVVALAGLAATAAGLAVITGLDLAVPGRAAVTFGVALTAPGAAVVVWARLGDRVLAAVAAVVVSLALVILVAQGMVLATWWRPQVAMTILLALSAASLVAHALRVTASRRLADRAS